MHAVSNAMNFVFNLFQINDQRCISLNNQIQGLREYQKLGQLLWLKHLFIQQGGHIFTMVQQDELFRLFQFKKVAPELS